MVIRAPENAPGQGASDHTPANTRHAVPLPAVCYHFLLESLRPMATIIPLADMRAAIAQRRVRHVRARRGAGAGRARPGRRHARAGALRPADLGDRPLQLPLRLLHAEGRLRRRLSVPAAHRPADVRGNHARRARVRRLGRAQDPADRRRAAAAPEGRAAGRDAARAGRRRPHADDQRRAAREEGEGPARRRALARHGEPRLARRRDVPRDERRGLPGREGARRHRRGGGGRARPAQDQHGGEARA